MSKILVVEDEQVSARRLADALVALGHEVVAVCATGVEAIRKAEELRPELALMDVQLTGELDGVAVGRYLRSSLGIPVVYLTGAQDERTFQRALETDPLGYLAKPFDDRTLRGALHTALYKHRLEQRLQESEARAHAVLRCTQDAVFTVDTQGVVTSVNPPAAEWAGWPDQSAVGRPVSQVVQLKDADGVPVDPTADVLAGRKPREDRQVLTLQSAQGTHMAVQARALAVRDARGRPSGAVLALMERESEAHQEGSRVRSEARTLALMDLMPGALLHVSAAGRILGCYGRVDALQGATGRRLSEVVGQDGAAILEPAIQDALRSGVGQELDGAAAGLSFSARVRSGGDNDAWLLLLGQLPALQPAPPAS